MFLRCSVCSPPCCLEKTFFCLRRRGTLSITGLKKVTWKTHKTKHEKKRPKKPTHILFLRSETAFQVWRIKATLSSTGACGSSRGGRAHLSVCLSTSDSPFISLFLFCRCVVCVYLSQQQALRLQLQLNSVLLVVQELLQLQVLKSAQRAVVLPVNCDLHLPRLKRRHPAVSTERKAALNKLFGACVQVCGKEIVYWPFQAPQWTSGPRPALPQSSKQSDPPLCYPASAPHSPQLNTHANQWFPSLMNPKMHKIIKKN